MNHYKGNFYPPFSPLTYFPRHPNPAWATTRGKRRKNRKDYTHSPWSHILYILPEPFGLLSNNNIIYSKLYYGEQKVVQLQGYMEFYVFSL